MNPPPRNQATPSRLEHGIALRIQALRRNNGLTLKELGRLTGLFESYLSRVENGRTAINIANLALVAEVFVLPFSALIEPSTDQSGLNLTRSGGGKGIRSRGKKGINIRLLAQEVADRLMEPFIVDVNSASPAISLESHEGQEFMYVLQGSCRFHHGFGIHDLEAGDSVFFDATVPHKTELLGHRKTECLGVITGKNHPFPGNISRWINNNQPQAG